MSMKKFPSIPHLPFSGQVNSDDIQVKGVSKLLRTEVVITEKLDGGNCCIKGGKVFARSHNEVTQHPWFGTIKGLVASNPLFHSPEISKLMIFGENMTAIHSIKYKAVHSYLFLFAVYDPSSGEWFSYDEVVKIAARLELPTTPLLFRGKMKNMKELQKWWTAKASEESELGGDREGFVIRTAGRFHLKQFVDMLAKWVRKGHVQTSKDFVRTWKKVTLVAGPELPSVEDLGLAGADEPVPKPPKKKKKKGKAKKDKKSKPSSKTLPSIIICVGAPGSGKSTFAERLCADMACFERVGTDLLGSRRAVESRLGTMYKRGATKRAVVENMNLTEKKRKEVLECAFKPRKALCVHFDYPILELAQRCNQRTHQTGGVFKGKGGNKKVASFIKSLQPPTTKEGFEKVVTVRSPEEVDRLLAKLGAGPVSAGSAAASPSPEAETGYDEVKEAPRQGYSPAAAAQGAKLDLGRLLKTVGVAPKDALNVYVSGSRLWGTNRPDSDFDVVVVTKASKKSQDARRRFDKGGLDAMILDDKLWKQECQDHKFICAITPHMPKEAVWQEKLPFSRCCPKFKPKEFRKALQHRAKNDSKKVAKNLAKGKADRAQRTMTHSLRWLHMGAAIIRHHESRAQGQIQWAEVLDSFVTCPPDAAFLMSRAAAL